MDKRRWLASVGAAANVLVLSACGGGGGGPVVSTPAPALVPTPPPPPPPPPPVTGGTNDTAEYRRSNAAVAANALSAYDAGYTGHGVKIGIIDTGIKTTLAEFSGKIDPASRDVAGSRLLDDGDGHGSAVADVAAGARNGAVIQGVAFDSSIVMLRADDPGSCATPKTDTGGGCSFLDPAIAAGVDAARLAGARVINMSLGGSSPGIELTNAMSRAVSGGIVLVISAGNDGTKPEGANPDPFALSPAQRFPGSVIIAGSIGASDGAGGTDLNALSDFSNKAGTGANAYLAARGYRDTAISNDGKTYLWSGTSFSAPTISGAVALLAQAFPNLTGQQIVDILFRSADDLGAAGVDSTYGHGRLDIARAIQPIGATSLASTNVAVSTDSNGTLPAAAGDAASAGPMGAVILDGYSRAYVIDLARTLRRTAASEPLRQAISGRTRAEGFQAGRFGIAMTVSQRDGTQREYELAKLGIGPRDAQWARLIAGSAVARIDARTAAAFGFAEGAKAMEQRLSGQGGGAFLIAHDVGGNPGFAARPQGALVVRHSFGPVSASALAESGQVWQGDPIVGWQPGGILGAPYRLSALSLDRAFGVTWVSAEISRLAEQRTLLGGQMGAALGGGGSSTMFLDLKARRDFGGGYSAALSVRRGWTSFAAGRFQSDAYAFDIARDGIFEGGDRLGLRLAQPLRIAAGGFTVLLPTRYDYATATATSTVERFSLSPSGREVDTELLYGRPITNGWLGGNLFMRRQPGHIARADSDVGGAIRFTLGF